MKWEGCALGELKFTWQTQGTTPETREAGSFQVSPGWFVFKLYSDQAGTVRLFDTALEMHTQITVRILTSQFEQTS